DAHLFTLLCPNVRDRGICDWLTPKNHRELMGTKCARPQWREHRQGEHEAHSRERNGTRPTGADGLHALHAAQNQHSLKTERTIQMTAYERLRTELKRKPKTWLVTGAAGFIGSNIVESLLKLDQNVVGMDNFETSKKRNLGEVRELVGPSRWRHFKFVERDICDLKFCQRACRGVDLVLHQAALGSVPRSIEDPLHANACNVSGFLNMLVAARDNHVKR